jgi:flagellar basal body rod protein FlgC
MNLGRPVTIVRQPMPSLADSVGGVGSQTDPVVEALEVRRAQAMYTANAEVVSSQEQQFGNFLNILDTQVNLQAAQESKKVS